MAGVLCVTQPLPLHTLCTDTLLFVAIVGTVLRLGRAWAWG